MENNFFVYQYFDPIRNEPIYIGAGHNNRDKHHLKRKDVNPFVRRILWIKKQGMEPIITKLHENLDYFDAFTIEPFLIEKIGRKDLGKGPLLNLSGGGEGNIGYKFTKNQKIKISKSICGPKNPMFGKFHSNQTKDKIRNTLKEKNLIPTNAGDYKITFPNGETKEIRSLTRFCKNYKLHRGHILKGFTKGFHAERLPQNGY